jgi:hypothetical protein
MTTRHRVLVAAQAPVSALLEDMLKDAVDVVAVDSPEQAFDAIAAVGGVALIVCTMGFDESRMVEFLQEVRRRPQTAGTPFLAVRVVRRLLSDELIERLGTVALQCGAQAFLDLARLDAPAAERALKAKVAKLLAH